VIIFQSFHSVKFVSFTRKRSARETIYWAFLKKNQYILHIILICQLYLIIIIIIHNKISNIFHAALKVCTNSLVLLFFFQCIKGSRKKRIFFNVRLLRPYIPPLSSLVATFLCKFFLSFKKVLFFSGHALPPPSIKLPGHKKKSFFCGFPCQNFSSPFFEYIWNGHNLFFLWNFS